MGSLRKLFTPSETIFFGIIDKHLGNDIYNIIVSGVKKIAYNTLNKELSSDTQVILNRINNKIFIAGTTNLVPKKIKRIYKNG